MYPEAMKATFQIENPEYQPKVSIIVISKELQEELSSKFLCRYMKWFCPFAEEIICVCIKFSVLKQCGRYFSLMTNANFSFPSNQTVAAGTSCQLAKIHFAKFSLSWDVRC